jgi:hypothetical protein
MLHSKSIKIICANTRMKQHSWLKIQAQCFGYTIQDSKIQTKIGHRLLLVVIRSISVFMESNSLFVRLYHSELNVASI